MKKEPKKSTADFTSQQISLEDLIKIKGGQDEDIVTEEDIIT